MLTLQWSICVQNSPSHTLLSLVKNLKLDSQKENVKNKIQIPPDCLIGVVTEYMTKTEY